MQGRTSTFEFFCLLVRNFPVKPALMKSLAGTLKYALLGAGALLLTGCLCLMHPLCCKYKVITPSMKLTDQQSRELVKTLKQYDKSLYKIQVYRKGKLVRTEGDLPDEQLRDGLMVEVERQVQAASFSGFAVQAGAKGGSSTNPKPTGVDPEPKGPSAGSSTNKRLDCADQGTLFSRLDKILPKYHK